MTVYVPGTLETDPKKIIMSLQQVGPGLDTANTNIATNTANIATNTANIATNTTNIATNTTNIGTLQTQTAGYEAAWTAYTPTLTAGSGSFTSASASGRYKQIGKTIFVRVRVTITTNGTAAGNVGVSLPFTSLSGFSQTAFGREDSGTTNKMLVGLISPSSATMLIVNYDSTYPGASGALLDVTTVYEST